MAVPFPVLAPITSTIIIWIPLQEIFHLVRYPNRQSAITGGRAHFIPFPVLGYAISGTVIHWAPYRNWALCVWSHFRYGALPVPVRSFTGPRTETGLYARGPISGTGLCHSGTVIHWAPYQNWTLCPVGTLLVGLWFDDNGVMDDDVNDNDGDGATMRMTTTMAAV